MNPYEPPSRSLANEIRHPVLRMTARTFVFLYAVLFMAFRLWSTTDAVQTGKPIAETILWVVFDALVCYGMFALALPAIRIRLFARSWRYIAIAIPVIVYSTAAWDIATDAIELTAIEFAVIGTLFLLATTPAIVFNFILGQKLLKSFRLQTRHSP